MSKLLSLIACIVLFACNFAQAAGPFVHPGMLQTQADLDFMRKKVLAGEEPWKTAWENLRQGPVSQMDFQPKPVTHIFRGSYGKPGIGDMDLMDSARAAHSQAIQWIMTGDRAHATKAIEILNAWSSALWTFDGNDAKLLAGWSGHEFCNAAEILLHSDSGWKEQDVAQFKRLMLTVYLPLIGDFLPSANGNWDATMMNTMMCIGIFCDDRAIFDNAVNHFLYGPGNSGVTKYIYPNGECEESGRDQGHTQLGLGELAQACQVAWSQGVDLYGAADDRLAVGFEYTAKYMLGDEVPARDALSELGRGRFSDIYELIYQHYHFEKGFDMPSTWKAVKKTRGKRPWSALLFYKGRDNETPARFRPLPVNTFATQAGAFDGPTKLPPANAIKVGTNQSIQAALDSARPGGWVVLAKGYFELGKPLRIPSNVTLSGQGSETVLALDPKISSEEIQRTIVNATDGLRNVTLRDFVVEGIPNPAVIGDPNHERGKRAARSAANRAGIVFYGSSGSQMTNIRLEHLTVRQCSQNGVAIRGASGISIIDCDFSDSGGSVTPGPGLQQNLLLSRVAKVEVNGCRLDQSPWGSGLDISFGHNITITNAQSARNARYGIHMTDCSGVTINGCLLEGNDRDGVGFDTLLDGCRQVVISRNIARNNGGCGINASALSDSRIFDNKSSENGCDHRAD